MTSVQQLRILIGQGRFAEVLQQTEADVDAAALSMRAHALRRLGRDAEALTLRRRLVELQPTSAVAEHNLAALLGDLHKVEAAEVAARRALAKGGQAPETWLVLARALSAQMRFDEAEVAFRNALARRPNYDDALQDLCQLIWMRTGDREATLAPLQHGTVVRPALRAHVREYLGDPLDAIAADLAREGEPSDVHVRLALAHLLLDLDPIAALEHAQVARELAPGELAPRHRVCEALLAAGRPKEALAELSAIRRQLPEDQSALALSGLARRLLDMTGDPLDDLSSLVMGQPLAVPAGWLNLAAYLEDLARDLRGLHRLDQHPIGQSLRHGTQTTVDLSIRPEPSIKAFFTAVDPVVRAYLAILGQGADAVRARNTGQYRVTGCWSVLLRPGGFHAPHIHSNGWLSSACHIEVPDRVDQGREGWLEFGRSPIGGAARLEPVHYERPQPGRLVLFPSCIWHGTAPFQGARDRLTLAFDLVPA